MSLAIVTAAPPAFLSEVVVLLAACAFIAYVCHRFGIMPIVSFLLTGAILGPHALRLVRDEALIEAAAELGVILLLFTIGIEFSLAKLARIKRIIFLGGGLQTGLVVVLVTGLLVVLGVEWRTGVFTGFLVALSSTAIVMKLLMDEGRVGSLEGQAALGILIFQDLAVVGMVLLIPILGGSGVSGWEIALALGKAAGIVALVLLAARRIMPRVLEAVARTCSQEIFLLSVVGICLGTAFLTSLAGVSLSLGAFLAGLVVSESRFSQLAVGEILPLQILFSATFFVSVGLLLDLSFLIQYPLLVLVVIGAVLVIKFLTTAIGLRVLGYGTGAAACTALALAQVGEFSFVLERTGRGLGLFPAGYEVGGPEAFIGATVTLMIATPFLYRVGEVLRRRTVSPREGTPQETEPRGAMEATPSDLRDHVIIAGYGEVGRRLAPILEERQIPYVILTLSPDGAREAEQGKLRVLRGNYTRQHELTLTGLRSARLFVVADDDLDTTRRVIAAARALNPELTVFARTRLAVEARELKQAGAREVVADDEESLLRLLTRVLQVSAVSEEEIQRYLTSFRSTGGAGKPRPEDDQLEPGGGAIIDVTRPVALTDAERRGSACPHVVETNEVLPRAAGCEECLKTGDRWVHLRICMTCGHVGCCDSSPNRHATQHHRQAGHPIVRSLEPGERWTWCYADRRFL